MGWVDNATPEIEAQSDYKLIIAICVSFSVVSISVVCTRLYIRHTSHGLRADDHMSALSMVFALIYSVLAIIQSKYGLGLPLALRPKASTIPYTRVNFAGRPIYQMGISFFKVALLISYLRLFQGTGHSVYRRVVWITIAAVLAGHLGCSLSLIFACTPVYKSWEPATVGVCLDPGTSFTAYAVVTIISDLAVTIIPIPVLLKLKIGNGKKAGLIFIFVLGLFTTLCSVFRYMQIDRIKNGDGNSTMLIVWGVIEFNVGNMCSSLPFLAPVFVRKAKEYSQRYPYGAGRGSAGHSGANHKLGGGSSGDKSSSGKSSSGVGSYKLSSISQGRGVFSSSQGGGGGGGGGNSHVHMSQSEEDILKERPDDNAVAAGILKSVSYSVRVEDEESRAGVGGGGPAARSTTRPSRGNARAPSP